MKTLIITSLISLFAIVGDIPKIVITEADLVSVEIDYTEIKYAKVWPKHFCGTYSRSSTTSYSTTECVVVLKEDGTCTTEWYNSKYTNKPKRNTTSGTWGLVSDHGKPQPFIDNSQEGVTWYKIILMSDDGKNLEFYDKPKQMEWVAVYSADDVYLKCSPSTLGKVKRK